MEAELLVYASPVSILVPDQISLISQLLLRVKQRASLPGRENIIFLAKKANLIQDQRTLFVRDI